MKIRVNYDLIDKIKEQNIGFSLIKTRRDVIKFTILFLPLDFLISFGDMQTIIFNCLFRLGMSSAFFSVCEKYLFPGFNQERAKKQLKALASLLSENYINTDYELLQEAYEYETNYSFILDENKFPRLKQEKYIMVPVVDRDGEKEVSLVQEHLLGTDEYELSYGIPKKVLKPVVRFA